jgi:hypothetical protein
LVIFSLFLFATSHARSEVFLGEEPKSAEKKAETEEEPREMPKLKSNRSSRSGGESGSRWGGSLGVGAGAGFFAAHGSLSYGFNRFTGLSMSYDYERVEQNERFGEEHGPDLLYVLRIPNPTMVTPVAGAGPGYLYWSRSHNEVVFDENQSPVMNYFAGLNIALSKNFGVAIHRRKTEFLRNRPIKYRDRVTKEDQARVDSNIGFYAAF